MAHFNGSLVLNKGCAVFFNLLLFKDYFTAKSTGTGRCAALNCKKGKLNSLKSIAWPKHRKKSVYVEQHFIFSILKAN